MKDKAWLKEEVENILYRAVLSFQIATTSEGNIIYDEIEKKIEQLDEPEKPVIPQFIANWIESYRKKTLVELINDAVYSSDEDSQCFRRWFHEEMGFESNYDEFLSRVWLDGYTIEKEPQWVVKDDTGYLSYLQFSIPNIYERETSLDKNDAYKFNSKSKADLIADLVTGTVEEVTE